MSEDTRCSKIPKGKKKKALFSVLLSVQVFGKMALPHFPSENGSSFPAYE